MQEWVLGITLVFSNMFGQDIAQPFAIQQTFPTKEMCHYVETERGSAIGVAIGDAINDKMHRFYPPNNPANVPSKQPFFGTACVPVEDFPLMWKTSILFNQKEGFKSAGAPILLDITPKEKGNAV